MTQEDLKEAVIERTLLSPALKASPDEVAAIERLPVCIVCPAARWYKIEYKDGVGTLECFCTQFRSLMFEPPKRIVTVCDGYIDAANE